jgi:hypothetical protein
MKFKEGVSLDIRPEMAKALPIIDAAYDAIVNRDAVITSGTDGKHMAGSLHYKQLAVDTRTRDLTHEQVASLATALRATLNGSSTINRPYQVVVEPGHMHIEYQPHD